ncbi:MAG: hypothetical protein PHH13_02135 [Candidatus Peribacteraceae bacterium]|nr:hypothetical protein [Candidatus Peribacteraceae bacterium]
MEKRCQRNNNEHTLALPITKDDQAPATKVDIRAVRDNMNTFKEEILRHFDLTVETIRHDLQDTNRETVKGRVTRLKRHTGLVPA